VGWGVSGSLLQAFRARIFKITAMRSRRMNPDKGRGEDLRRQSKTPGGGGGGGVGWGVWGGGGWGGGGGVVLADGSPVGN